MTPKFTGERLFGIWSEVGPTDLTDGKWDMLFQDERVAWNYLAAKMDELAREAAMSHVRRMNRKLP